MLFNSFTQNQITIKFHNHLDLLCIIVAVSAGEVNILSFSRCSREVIPPTVCCMSVCLMSLALLRISVQSNYVLVAKSITRKLFSFAYNVLEVTYGNVDFKHFLWGQIC